LKINRACLTAVRHEADFTHWDAPMAIGKTCEIPCLKVDKHPDLRYGTGYDLWKSNYKQMKSSMSKSSHIGMPRWLSGKSCEIPY